MVPEKSYVGYSLSLRDRVYFFILVDPNTKKALGKVIHPAKDIHFSANNSTAAHLLYLLSQPKGLDIDFDQMKQLVMQKYDLTDPMATDEINTFLGKLDSLYTVTVGSNTITYGILDSKTADTITDDPDPCGLFNVKTKDWDPNPDLVPGLQPPKIRDQHMVGCGNQATKKYR